MRWSKNPADWLQVLFESALYRAIVDFIRDFFHILWICRISTVSVALGFLAMLFAPQTLDLFQEVGGFLREGDQQTYRYEGIKFAAIFGASVLFLWAIPVHFAARWSLDCLANPPNTASGRRWCNLTEPRPDLNRWLVEYLPRILGLMCFVAVWLGIRRATDGSFGRHVIELAGHAEDQLSYLGISTIVSAVAFILYVSYRANLFNLINRFTGKVISPDYSRTAFAFVCVAIVTILLGWFIVDPYTTLKSRVMVVPIVLGAWVPLLSFVTWMSYAAHLPVLMLAILLIIALKVIAGDGHELDTMRGDLAATPARLGFGDAVQLWMDKNGCAKDPAKCPHPIVVAAAGGASRAAYVTASTLGYFMDLTCPPNAIDGEPVVPCKSNETPAFANRVFAISGVSGGALGAAVFSALLKAQQEQRDIPCQRGTEGVFWFRDGKPLGWRDCVQLILSEDFLSPPLLGLAFRDQVPFLPGPDRAGLLEDAFIKAFAKYVLRKPEYEKSERPSGLAAPFESFAPSREHWRPLLIFNGTSVSTGRRILTSHIATKDENKSLFDDAYDVFQLINHDGETNGQNGVRTISLATAVTNSGRFPVLTPPGALPDQSKKNLRDQIVDGGYFENYGVTTAYEIARELKNGGLDPRILLITNEPMSVERVQQLDNVETVPPLTEPQRRRLLDSLSSPFHALYGTRDSRGDLAVIRTFQSLRPGARSKEDNPVAHITVYGTPADGSNPPDNGTRNGTKFKYVSMSLWLSKPVQEYLDRQFFRESFSSGMQQEMLRRMCRWLGHPVADRCRQGVAGFTERKS